MLATVNSPLVMFLIVVMRQEWGVRAVQRRRMSGTEAAERRLVTEVVEEERLSCGFQG